MPLPLGILRRAGAIASVSRYCCRLGSLLAKSLHLLSRQASRRSSKPAASRGDFSKEALVFDKMLTSIREEADGTGTRQTTARIRILADAGVKEMAVLTFTYTAMNQQVDIAYVRVIKPDGTVVVTPGYNIQDLPADVTRTAPMYSDIHQKHVAVKGLGVGDVLEYQVTLPPPRLRFPAISGWNTPSRRTSFSSMKSSISICLPTKFFSVPARIFSPNHHRREGTQALPLVQLEPGQARSGCATQINQARPSLLFNSLPSRVGSRLAPGINRLQQRLPCRDPGNPGQGRRSYQGAQQRRRQIRAIFNDVALHIHYVGLEFGIGRYQPHPADDVLSNEYGDCKDKHTLAGRRSSKPSASTRGRS